MLKLGDLVADFASGPAHEAGYFLDGLIQPHADAEITAELGPQGIGRESIANALGALETMRDRDRA